MKKKNKNDSFVIITQRWKKIASHMLLAVLILISTSFLETFCLSQNPVGTAGKKDERPIQVIKWLIFSSINHPYERELVKRHERITSAQSKEGKIFIALVDLDDDGYEEIFAYIDIFEYCGQKIGCPLNIYKNKSGKLISLLRPEFIHGFPMFIEINNIGRQNEIGILTSKSMGLRDIVLKGGAVWKWNGKDYRRN